MLSLQLHGVLQLLSLSQVRLRISVPLHCLTFIWPDAFLKLLFISLGLSPILPIGLPVAVRLSCTRGMSTNDGGGDGGPEELGSSYASLLAGTETLGESCYWPPFSSLAAWVSPSENWKRLEPVLSKSSGRSLV